MRIRYLVALLLSPFMVRGQKQPDFSSLPHNNPLTTALDSLVHTNAAIFFSKADAPGVVLSVIRNGHVQYYCYGYADKVQKQLFTDTTLLEIGSITKTFTAAILLRLQEDGVLSVDQSLADFFPEAAKENSSLQDITLRQLLNHSAGMPRLPENLDKVRDYAFLQPYEHYTKDNLLELLKTIKPGPAGKYDYSNLGFGILGTIAEIKSGKDYGSLLETYVFAPIGMRHSSTTGNSLLSKATGYMENDPVAYWQFDCLAGAGAIKSTTGDMMMYLQACLGQTSNKDIIMVINQAIQPSLKINEGLSIGMAWHIMTGRTAPIYWHNGGTYGFSTFAAFEPKSQTAIFAAANAFNVNGALEAFSGKILINITETK